MIFGNETISAYTRPNMAIWMILAFQAGLLNVGGLMASHTFVSHVTGFAPLFALEMQTGQQAHAYALLLIPLTFLVGAMISGVLVDLRLKLKKDPRYYIVFGVLFFLTLVLVISGFNNQFGDFGRPLQDRKGYALVILLCLICGIQNGTITLVSKSIVRTTHLTGITTDLGIGLVRVLNGRRLQGSIPDEWRANLMRIGIIGFFLLGSAVGVSIYREWQYRGFLFPCFISGLLFATTLYFQVLRKK